MEDAAMDATDALSRNRRRILEGGKPIGESLVSTNTGEEFRMLLETLYVLGAAIAGASAELHAILSAQPKTKEPKPGAGGSFH